jgi:hypothetical protein
VDQVNEQFEYGDKVEHPVFGIGQVLAFIGDGERLKLLIKFRDHGEKKIAVRHARLKRLSDRPTLAAAAASAALPKLEVEPVKAVKKTIIPAGDATKDFGPIVDEDEDEEELIEDEDDDDGEFESLEDLEEDEEEEDEE